MQLGEAEVLQARVELRRKTVTLQQANNDRDQALRKLMSFVGLPRAQPATLVGTLETEQTPIDWEVALSQLLASSPQVVAATKKKFDTMKL